jgi:glucan phosphoethanolaminetransferase (alkaline phosphatase superfamily)
MWWITPLDHHQFRLLWCHPRVLAPMLMTVGILSAVVQFIGACFLVSGYKDYYTSGYQTDIALNATRSGLAVHLAVLTAITIIGLRYILVSRRWIDRSPSYALRPGANWRLLSWTIYAALIAVVVSHIPNYIRVINE